jgi:ribosomal protein S18 acetylase RimI-like enzyme
MTYDSPGSGLLPLRPDQLEAAVALVVRAFANDPHTLAVAHPSERVKMLPPFYRLALRYALRYGEVWVTSSNLEGLAWWMPPGHSINNRQLLSVGALGLPFQTSWEFLRRQLAFEAAGQEAHKRMADFPHWYLVLLAVDPPQQGRGWARRLLESQLERIDRESFPCYLETYNERNLTFYARYGFRVAGEFKVAHRLTGYGLVRPAGL